MGVQVSWARYFIFIDATQIYTGSQLHPDNPIYPLPCFDPALPVDVSLEKVSVA
jgi:hypothetical protein